MENKKWYEKFRWYTSSDGFLVVAGKDTVSNEVLIKKYTTKEDVVFHAEITDRLVALLGLETLREKQKTEKRIAADGTMSNTELSDHIIETLKQLGIDPEKAIATKK